MTGPTRQDRLDPAERALADALARGAGAQGPSPALDAAVLGAARAATARTAAGVGVPARRHRRRPAWLRAGALAASVVLAVGVAWQLRPTFEAGDHAVEAGDGLGAAPAVASDGSAAAAAVSGARSGKRMQAREALPVAFDEPAPMDAPESATLDVPAPKPAPAPPAPPRAPAPPERAPQDARPAPRAPAPAVRPAVAPSPETRSAAPPIHAEDAAGLDGHAGGEDWLDQPLDDTPPASVDSPLVRDAWLARIRELVSAERYTEARESFAEFRRRYPDAELPADLLMLLGTE